MVAFEWGSDPDGDGGYSTVVSYVQTQVGHRVRIAPAASALLGRSATPSSSFVVAHDLGTPTVTLNPTGFSYQTNQGWTSTQGLYGVTLNVNDSPGERVLLRAQRRPERELVDRLGDAKRQEPRDLPGCNLANPGSGTYANVLCFADFSAAGASAATQASYLSTFTHPSATCTQMKYSIADSPDLLQFCLSVSPVSGNSGRRSRHRGFPPTTTSPGRQQRALLGQQRLLPRHSGRAGDIPEATAHRSVRTERAARLHVRRRQRRLDDAHLHEHRGDERGQRAGDGLDARDGRRRVDRQRRVERLLEHHVTTPSTGRFCRTAPRPSSATPATTPGQCTTATPVSSSTQARSRRPIPPWAIPEREPACSTHDAALTSPHQRRTRCTRQMPRRWAAKRTASWTRQAP